LEKNVAQITKKNCKTKIRAQFDIGLTYYQTQKMSYMYTNSVKRQKAYVRNAVQPVNRLNGRIRMFKFIGEQM